MLKIRDDVDLKELEKFRFWKEEPFNLYHRGLYDDCIEQFNKSEYVLVTKNKVIVKGKLTSILDFNGNIIVGYKTSSNNIKNYIQDLIKANLGVKE